MLSIVGGLPGSGKSFFAANYLASFGKWDALYNTYVFSKDILIYTNIDGFRLEHKTLESCFEEAGSMEQFFTIPNFQSIRVAYPHHRIVVIVDEAQRYFHTKFNNNDVEFFFEYHRHVGIDLFLLSNAIPKLKKTIVGLSDNIVEAQPRSFGLPGVFRYKYKDITGTFLRSKTIKAKPEVFSIYKSFTTDESEKPKNILLHWGVMFLVLFIVAFGGFKAFASHFANKGRRMHDADIAAKKPAVGPISQSVVAPGQTGAIQRPLSSVSVVAASPALMPDDRVEKWRVYSVQGVLHDGHKSRYIIQGNLIDGRHCRSFQPETMTIEYFGYDLPDVPKSANLPALVYRNMSSVHADLSVDPVTGRRLTM